MSRSLRVGSASIRHVRPLELGTSLKSNTREGFLARGFTLFRNVQLWKVRVFFGKCHQNPQNLKIQVDFGNRYDLLGAIARPLAPCTPWSSILHLRVTLPRTSRREGLAEFGPSATVIREVKFEISTKISEVDFMTFFWDPPKFHMKPSYAVILCRGTLQPLREVVGCSERSLLNFFQLRYPFSKIIGRAPSARPIILKNQYQSRKKLDDYRSEHRTISLTGRRALLCNIMAWQGPTAKIDGSP